MLELVVQDEVLLPVLRQGVTCCWVEHERVVYADLQGQHPVREEEQVEGEGECV